MSVSKSDPIERCLEDIGLTLDEWFEMGAADGGPLDSVMVGACKTEGCAGTLARCEPDQREGWCDVCEKPSVESLASLVGII